jgi:hypothetical protein
MTPYQTLLTAFRALTKKQKANLRYHLKKRTRVLCGDMAYEYVDGEGGG